MANELAKKDAIISSLNMELAAAKVGGELAALRSELNDLKINLGVQTGRAEEYRKMLEAAKAEAETAFMKGLESGAIVASKMR